MVGVNNFSQNFFPLSSVRRKFANELAVRAGQSAASDHLCALYALCACCQTGGVHVTQESGCTKGNPKGQMLEGTVPAK